jgi:hypothetical protein
MQQAAALLGEHDFSSFRAAQCQAHSPVKTLRASTSAPGRLLALRVRSQCLPAPHDPQHHGLPDRHRPRQPPPTGWPRCCTPAAATPPRPPFPRRPVLPGSGLRSPHGAWTCPTGSPDPPPSGYPGLTHNLPPPAAAPTCTTAPASRSAASPARPTWTRRAAGADAIGFVLYPPSPRFVSPERAGRTGRPLPPSSRRCCCLSTPAPNTSPKPAQSRAQAPCCSSTATKRPPTAPPPRAPLPARRPHSPRPAGRLRSSKIRARLRRRPGHPARRPRRGLRRRRSILRLDSIPLVTSASKRQLSPRFVWWTHACKRDRWHSPAYGPGPLT